MVGFPVRSKGHHSDPDHLSRAVVGFVRLNEGGEVFGLEGQLRLVGENLNLIHMTFDVEEVRASVDLIQVDLRSTTLDSILSNCSDIRNIWMDELIC